MSAQVRFNWQNIQLVPLTNDLSMDRDRSMHHDHTAFGASPKLNVNQLRSA